MKHYKTTLIALYTASCLMGCATVPQHKTSPLEEQIDLMQIDVLHMPPDSLLAPYPDSLLIHFKDAHFNDAIYKISPE